MFLAVSTVLEVIKHSGNSNSLLYTSRSRDCIGLCRGGSRKKNEGGFMCRPPTVKLAQKIKILCIFRQNIRTI